MLHSMCVSNMDHRSDGNMDHKKHASITFNLFHFIRHRVPYIQDDEKRVNGKQGGLIDYLV